MFVSDDGPCGSVQYFDPSVSLPAAVNPRELTLGYRGTSNFAIKLISRGFCESLRKRTRIITRGLGSPHISWLRVEIPVLPSTRIPRDKDQAYLHIGWLTVEIPVWPSTHMPGDEDQTHPHISWLRVEIPMLLPSTRIPRDKDQAHISWLRVDLDCLFLAVLSRARASCEGNLFLGSRYSCGEFDLGRPGRASENT